MNGKLKPRCPLVITPAGRVGAQVGNDYVSIEVSDRPGRESRTRYRWHIERAKGAHWTGDKLQSGAGGHGLVYGMENLVGFLSACAADARTAEGFKDKDSNAHLFPKAVAKWAAQHDGELDMLGLELHQAIVAGDGLGVDGGEGDGDPDWLRVCRMIVRQRDVLRGDGDALSHIASVADGVVRAAEKGDGGPGLPNRELATVLAALRERQDRLFEAQRHGENAEGHAAAFNDVATNHGSFEALSVAEIDALCQKLNTQP